MPYPAIFQTGQAALLSGEQVEHIRAERDRKHDKACDHRQDTGLLLLSIIVLDGQTEHDAADQGDQSTHTADPDKEEVDNALIRGICRCRAGTAAAAGSRRCCRCNDEGIEKYIQRAIDCNHQEIHNILTA